MSLEQAVVQLEQTNAALQEEVVRFRDAAMGLNSIYPTITEGRQAVADGKYFSVPGGGAYMRLYRRQGSSAALIAEFPDVATLNGLIAQLGPLLGRGVVGGTGDIMAQGAFGLGSTTGQYLNDIGARIESGFYSYDPSTTGDLPSSAGGLIRFRRSSRVFDLSIHESRSNPMVSVRAFNDSWGNWFDLITRRDFLGTVSQAEGAPTGAITERGSNGFGRWTKFANGLRIQTTTRLSIDMSVTGNATASYTLPQSVSDGATAFLTADLFSSGIESFTRTATRVGVNSLAVWFANRDGNGTADFGFRATVIDYWY